MTDPFEHFEEQERSWSLLQTLGKKLAASAEDRLRTTPWEPLAGLIIETGTRQIRKTLKNPPPEWKTHGVELAAVVERSLMETILLGNGGEHVLSWLKENSTGDEFPVLVCTRNGYRTLLIKPPP